jgi:hypothetical protein
MKKTIRLTESDLTNIIKRVINEQQSNTKIDYKALEPFLNGINVGGGIYYSKWILDPSNPNKRSGNVKLTGKEFLMNTLFVNKPLVWSLMVNGVKEKYAIFEIFSANGKLYYQCFSSNSGTSATYSNSDGYKELQPNLNSAIAQFNQRVFLQKK